ncbi:hypothetical protein BURKHO8Y_70103 [Burkholderia sp. 8Y]|nr:hypothetical protein BURKHO8Y_70103 [Burkholderia sp. 8Y]
MRSPGGEPNEEAVHCSWLSTSATARIGDLELVIGVGRIRKRQRLPDADRFPLTKRLRKVLDHISIVAYFNY